MDGNLGKFLADVQETIMKALEMPPPEVGINFQATTLGIEAHDGSGVTVLIVSGPLKLHDEWIEQAVRDNMGPPHADRQPTKLIQ